jgi:hypothetical protein
VETADASDRKDSVVRMIRMKIKLVSGEVDRSWAEKVVHAMRGAGATEVKIVADDDTGSSEVRASPHISYPDLGMLVF